MPTEQNRSQSQNDECHEQGMCDENEVGKELVHIR